MDHRFHKFIVLVDEGSFLAAARKMHISQPAMTIAIAQLEKQIGKKLFIKKKPHIELTKEGEIVYQSSKRVNKEVERMYDLLLKSNTINQNHIGIIDSIANLILNDKRETSLLKEIEIIVDNSVNIIKNILDNDLQYGIITGQTSLIQNGLYIKKLNDEPFVFVTRYGLGKNKKPTIINDWLAINSASTTYNHFIKVFKIKGLNVKPIFYSTNMEILKNMAVSGEGTALLPLHIVKNEIVNKKLEILETPKLTRPIWLISKNETDNEIIKKLTSRLNKLLFS